MAGAMTHKLDTLANCRVLADSAVQGLINDCADLAFTGSKESRDKAEKNAQALAECLAQHCHNTYRGQELLDYASNLKETARGSLRLLEGFRWGFIVNAVFGLWQGNYATAAVVVVFSVVCWRQEKKLRLAAKL